MSQAYHVRHEPHYSSTPTGYPTPDPYPPPPAGQGYQGYFHGIGGVGGFPPPPSAVPPPPPPPLRPYNQYPENYGSRCPSLLRTCLAALCCCCILEEWCI
ncbi:hypothetical protein HN51_060545 [Arachis hypogaea]|uniref:protein CYSTEINE-RICH TRANSMEMBRANE MODULE 7 n=2 Tax=Arachis TaxID=3817 RepID=UPI0007AF5DB0|nr:cysteine-rich and transmembrane domain-containing protein A-like isoform X1 [Arachis ipaensis]